ncbi:MAG: hypothetical protein ACYDCL_13790 [Myxococcales bacterium]
MSRATAARGPRGIASRLEQIRRGAASFAWPQPTVGLDGTLQTPAQLDAALAALLARFAAAHDAFLAYQEALQDRRKAEAQARALLTSMRTGFTAMLGRRHVDLAKLGFRPDVGRRKPTSGEKVVAASKRQGTRAALGTLGAAQKKARKATQKPPPPFRVTPTGKIALDEPAPKPGAKKSG